MSEENEAVEENEITVEEARQILAQRELNDRQAFQEELQELLDKYGFTLTARFELFGTTVNPPIRISRRQSD